MQKGDVGQAMGIAATYRLILDLRDSLDLTILAGKQRHPLYDRMGVRWIRVVDDRGRLDLAEVEHLAATFRALRRGDEDSTGTLWRFLATGRR